jgi:hypothetical protein
MTHFFNPELVKRIVELANADESTAPLYCELERAWWEADDSPVNVAMEPAWAEWDKALKKILTKLTPDESLTLQDAAGGLVGKMQHAAFVCGMVAGNPGALVVAGMLGGQAPKRTAKEGLKIT